MTHPATLEWLGDTLRDAVVAARERTRDDTLTACIENEAVFIDRKGERVGPMTEADAVGVLGSLS